jgi:chromosomal replication initiator protein
LTDALSEAAQRPITFAVTVDPTLADSALPAASSSEPRPTPASGGPSAAAPSRQDPGRPTDSGLQPRYTFDTFVIGPSNRFPAAAARAVAESCIPDTFTNTYNPLVIYGGAGLGKTHLMHAIGNYALALDSGLRVLYTTSESFTNHFINCVTEAMHEEFRRRYRQNDILLIDDIQFLTGKPGTMAEFFHTFNSIYNSGGHIVITSDTPPKLLDGFEERLRSRFESGLLTDVQPPELETRIAILRQKAAAEGMEAPPDVQEYIASRFSSNVRELEGALIRVNAFANLNHQQVDLPLAEAVLRDLVSNSQAEITPSLIIGQTAKYFSLTMEEIRGHSRLRRLVEARHIAMYLCRELTDLSLPDIGREFGGRDHTTILHGQKKIASFLSTEPTLFARVSELTSRIKQSAADQ